MCEGFETSRHGMLLLFSFLILVSEILQEATISFFLCGTDKASKCRTLYANQNQQEKEMMNASSSTKSSRLTVLPNTVLYFSASLVNRLGKSQSCKHYSRVPWLAKKVSKRFVFFIFNVLFFLQMLDPIRQLRKEGANGKVLPTSIEVGPL